MLRINTQASFGSPRRRRDHVPGQYIVKIAEQAVLPRLAGASLKFERRDADLLPEQLSARLDSLRKNAGLRAVKPLFSTRRGQLERKKGTPLAVRHSLAALTSVADSASEELRGVVMAEVDPKQPAAKVMQKLRGGPVEYVEPMPARWPMASATAADPLTNLQWGLRAIRWFDAVRASAAEVLLGVIDSGIDRTHPDLRNAVEAYDHEGTSAADIIGHGTHVAGTIAASANNGHGVVGVADCRLVVWKVFDDKPDPVDGEFYVDGDRYLRALRAMETAGVVAVNLSLGGTANSKTEALLFRRLVRAGVLPVAAMGNEYMDGNPTSYPAAYEGVLAVGATTPSRRRSPFSNTGKHIGLCAPGSGILSTVPVKKSAYREETEYVSWDGTSMATPHVAGAVALLKAEDPSLSPSEIARRLRATATRVPGMKGKAWSAEFGSGLLNVAAALAP